MALASDAVGEDGSKLHVVRKRPGDTVDALVDALALPPSSGLLLLAGGHAAIDPALLPKLTQLVGRGLVRAASQAGALCVDAAADLGVSALLGRSAQEAGVGLRLLGVAPEARVSAPDDATSSGTDQLPVAPGHTHLLLLPGDAWGSELTAKFDVVGKLAAGKPVLLVLIGGEPSAIAEVLQAVRRRWSVLLVLGSGGAADALAAQWAANAAVDDDPHVAEILADGALDVCLLGDKVGESVDTIARQLLREFGGESVLRQAWARFAAIDLAAIRQQGDFRRSQLRVLQLGVLAVLLAIVYSVIEPLTHAVPGGAPPPAWLLPAAEALRWLVVVVPVALSALIAGNNRFKPGKRWVLLRSAAESIKREIYRFRLRAEGYRNEGTREKNLAEQVEGVTRRLARTEANTTALPVYTGPIPPRYSAHESDDGTSLLSTDQYLRLRLDNQLEFFRGKTVRLENQLQWLQWGVILTGGVGTLLAAFGGVIWVALTTAVASAITAYLGYQQVESTLTNYNQTATDLENIRGWWTALQPSEQSDPANIEALAQHTEQVLADELAGWTQKMTDALEKLRDGPTVKDVDDKSKPLPETGNSPPP